VDINTLWSNAGTYPLVSTAEVQVWTGREGHTLPGSVQLISSTVDAGNTPTTSLRPGLLLGQITASGLWKHYDPAAIDGSQVARLVLNYGVGMLGSDGIAAAKEGPVLVTGVLNSSNLLLLDNAARKQLALSGRYTFNDDLSSRFTAGAPHLYEITIGAGTRTVTAAEVGALFVPTVACAFTLPAIAAGLGPFEFLNAVDGNMSVASAEGDNMVLTNDLTADSLAFSTASNKIGGRARVQANAAGTKWYVEILSPPACVVTVAT
jgi:Bacteriophage lambda head decoration protein D